MDMFSTQLKKSQSSDKSPLSTPTPAVFPLKISKDKVRERRLESQTRAVHDLDELFRLKTKQMDRYGHILDHKSNLYLQYQMKQSFL